MPALPDPQLLGLGAPLDVGKRKLRSRCLRRHAGCAPGSSQGAALLLLLVDSVRENGGKRCWRCHCGAAGGP